MHDSKNRFAPPSAAVSDSNVNGKAHPFSVGVLLLLSVSWLWLLSFSPAVFQLTRTGATNVFFMLEVYFALVLIPIGGIMFLRRSPKSVYVFGAAASLLLLAALHQSFLVLVASTTVSIVAAVVAARTLQQPHKPFHEA